MRRLILLLPALVALGGCTQFTTYNRARTMPAVTGASAGQMIFIDAKQRAVYATPVTRTVNGVTTTAITTCAEPSPDALSALAASGNASLSVEDKAALALGASLSETSSNIGLRTQSIQLMRDAMYRLCEGVSSGVLSSSQFETLHRRFQNSMVAILAIEQLSGVVRGPNAQLSTTAALGASKDVARLTEGAAKAREASTTARATADAKAKDVTAANAKRDTYLKEHGELESALTEAQIKEFTPLKQAATAAAVAKASADVAVADSASTLAIYETGMKAIGGGDLATSATALSTGGSGAPLSDGAASAVATAVVNIVERELDMGFFREACATLFIARLDGRVIGSQAGDFINKCDSYAAAEVGRLTAYVDWQTRELAIREANATALRAALAKATTEKDIAAITAALNVQPPQLHVPAAAFSVLVPPPPPPAPAK